MEQASAAENFIERMGLISQVDGAPRIAGRILGLLIVEGRPFTLDEMAERLKISKASASTNARQLRASGIIRLVAHAGDRHDYYELGSDPYRRAMETVSERLVHVGSEVMEAAASFPDAQAEARQRVCQFGHFYIRMGERLKAWSEQVEDEADPTTN